MVALRPLSPSVELAKFELSRSMPKMDRIPVVSREGVNGREKEPWYARLVFVPRETFASNVSAPPNAFRARAMML